MFPVNGLAKEEGKGGTEKISRCARNDSVGDGYPVHHTKNVWEKHVSRIVIGSGVEGSFSLAVRRSVFDSEKWETPVSREVEKARFPYRHPERSRGIFFVDGKTERV